jgi:hydrogenase maturation protease
MHQYDVEMRRKWIVLGIGNPYRQDDRAGLVVAERLRQGSLDCQVESLMAVGFEILEMIRGYERAIIVDACHFGMAPGAVVEVSVDELEPIRTPVNSHAITLGTALKTGYVCFPDEMPADIRILLIEVKEIGAFTQQMSSEVERAVEAVVDRVTTMVAAVA